MNRYFQKYAPAVAMSVFSISPALAGNNDRPNVLLILTDDQGVIDINRFGSSDLYTPVLDSLCSEGVMFTDFYSNASISSPSRASVLTGQYPWRAGVPDLVPRKSPTAGLQPEKVTIAEVLKENGYATALIGKWHLGETPQTHPNSQGFDYFFGHLGGCIDNWSHYFYWSGPNEHDLWRNREEVWYDGRNFSDLMTEEAVRFISENREHPFLLCFMSNYPHYPLQGDAKWREYYRNLDSPRDKYAAMVSTIDEKIGRVLGSLDEYGLKNNTIVIFMSDNGFSTEVRTFGGGGSAGALRGSKFSAYEGGIRVPAIIRYPGHIPAGIVCSETCLGFDWFPTILDFCDIPSGGIDLDGKSLKKVICEEASSPHDTLYWRMPKARAVRTGSFKLVSRDTSEGEILELYDLSEDESESCDLSEVNTEKTAELAAVLKKEK